MTTSDGSPPTCTYRSRSTGLTAFWAVDWGRWQEKISADQAAGVHRLTCRVLLDFSAYRLGKLAGAGQILRCVHI